MGLGRRVNPRSKMALIGIFALYATLCDFAVLTPALNVLSERFSDTPLTTILLANSITGIMTVPMSVLAGSVVNKVGYRPLAFLGLGIAILGGSFPFFMPDLVEYWPIIFSRILVGIGMGFVSPLGAALIISFYQGERRSFLLGIGNMVFFAGGCCYQIIGGYLADVGWNYTFLAYWVVFIPLVLAILFLPEAKGIITEQKKEIVDAPKVKIPGACWGYFIFATILLTCDLSSVFLTSSILAERAMGNAGTAGIIMTCYQIGGMISGLSFLFVVRKFKGKTYALCAVLDAVGMLIMVATHDVYVYGVGILLMGIGHSSLFLAAQNAAGNAAPKTRIAVVSGLMMAAMNLGAFLCTYYIGLVQAVAPSLGMAGPVLVAGVLIAGCAVVMLFLPFKNLRDFAIQDELAHKQTMEGKTSDRAKEQTTDEGAMDDSSQTDERG